VHRQTLHLWQQRYDDFSEPVVRLEVGKVWAWPDVDAWCRQHGKPEGR
jgi:hypothetical protein